MDSDKLQLVWTKFQFANLLTDLCQLFEHFYNSKSDLYNLKYFFTSLSVPLSTSQHMDQQVESKMKNQNQKPIRGLNSAIDLLVNSTRSHNTKKGSHKNKLQDFLSGISLQQQQHKKITQENQKQSQNSVKIQEKVFGNDIKGLSISQRVAENSRMHMMTLQNLDKASYQSVPSVHHRIENPEKKVEIEIQKNQQVPIQQQEKPTNNIFGLSIQPTAPINLFNNNLPASKSIFESNLQQKKNIFAQPTKEPLPVQKINIFEQKPSSEPNISATNLFSKPQEGYNLFGQKREESISPQIKPNPPAFNLFGNATIRTVNPNIYGAPFTSEPQEQEVPVKDTVEIQKYPAHQIVPEKTKPINIFREGLFQEDVKKPKPVLLFNNSAQLSNKAQQVSKQSAPKPEVKLFFNNNGAVVQSLKPKVNIFGGFQPIQETKQPEKAIELEPINKQEEPEQKPQIELSSPQKMQIQAPKEEVNPSVFRQQIIKLSNEPTKQSLFSNQQPSNIFSAQQKPSIFSNQQPPVAKLIEQQPKPSLFSNEQKAPSLFSNPQPVSEKIQVPTPRISLFGNNAVSNVTSTSSVSQGQQNKGGLFGSKLQTIKQEKSQISSIKQIAKSQNIFGNNNQPKHSEITPAPTFNLFQKKQQTTVKQTSGGLFGTPQANLFNQKPQQNQAAQTQQSNPVNIFAKKQEPSQSQNIFASSLQSSNMFSKAPQPQIQKVQQSSNLFKLPQQSQKQSNIFSSSQPAPTKNIFGNLGSQPNMFSGSSDNNMFKSGSQNIFSKPSAGGSLFGGSGPRGAELFSQKNEDSQDDEEGEGEGEDGKEVQESEPEVQGEIKYKGYLNTTIYAKLDAIKFKIVSTDTLYEYTKFSLQKLSEDDQTIYIIIRNANKTVMFFGLLLSISQLNVISENQKGIAFSIKNLIQIDELKGKKKTMQMWRIQFKNCKEAKDCIEECKKIINKLKSVEAESKEAK